MAREKKTAGKAGLFGKRKAEDEGFDIVTDLKEPFSFSNFFEEQVLMRARRFKELLADKGILFFLTSPFQARNRLIAEMAVLCVGILFGVVPRMSALTSQTRDKAYASEIEGLSEKNVGSLSITPAASSNYKRTHVLAFTISGTDLPSSASKYEVHLARSYGAADWNDVTYAWNIYPVSDSERILLVAIDQNRQSSGYGGFQLHIQLAGEELEDYEKEPFEIVVTSAQETGPLYDKNGIHLSALTEAICGTGTIKESQDAFEQALEKYQVVLEQAEAMPVGITVSPTVEELESACLANRVYRRLEDDSTTEDIIKIDEVDEMPEILVDTVLVSDGTQYDAEFMDELASTGLWTEEEAAISDAFTSVDSAKGSVISAMGSVNSAAVSWYGTLSEYKLILNQETGLDKFPYFARCTETIGGDIDYIDQSEFGPEEEPSGESEEESGDESGKTDESEEDVKKSSKTDKSEEEPDGESSKTDKSKESEEESDDGGNTSRKTSGTKSGSTAEPEGTGSPAMAAPSSKTVPASTEKTVPAGTKSRSDSE